jgi:hypothetical protein
MSKKADLLNIQVDVPRCEDTGCNSSIPIAYQATNRQLKALVEISEECTQKILV